MSGDFLRSALSRAYVIGRPTVCCVVVPPVCPRACVVSFSKFHEPDTRDMRMLYEETAFVEFKLSACLNRRWKQRWYMPARRCMCRYREDVRGEEAGLSADQGHTDGCVQRHRQGQERIPRPLGAGERHQGLHRPPGLSGRVQGWVRQPGEDQAMLRGLPLKHRTVYRARQ